MISEISKRIAVGLSRSSVIAEEDIDLYAYGFFSLLSKLLFFLVTAFFGILLKITVESILFYVLFSLLRTYAGGIHADKEWKCLCFTTTAMFLSVLCIKALTVSNPFLITVTLTFVFSLVIVCASPLETDEKPLRENERRKYKIITIGILVLYLFFLFVFVLIKKWNLYYTIVMVIWMAAVLLIIGITKRRYCNEK